MKIADRFWTLKGLLASRWKAVITMFLIVLPIWLLLTHFYRLFAQLDGSREYGEKMPCREYLAKINVALSDYIFDNDDRYPVDSHWLENLNVGHLEGCNIGINAKLLGVKVDSLPQDGDQIVLIESKNGPGSIVKRWSDVEAEDINPYVCILTKGGEVRIITKYSAFKRYWKGK